MLQIFTDILISIVVNVVSYYICKWLDRDEKDS